MKVKKTETLKELEKMEIQRKEKRAKTEKRNAIAYAVLKVVVKNDVSLKDIPQLKRKVGNLAKETGVAKEDLLEFSKNILKRVFEEQIEKIDAVEDKGKS